MESGWTGWDRGPRRARGDCRARRRPGAWGCAGCPVGAGRVPWRGWAAAAGRLLQPVRSSQPAPSRSRQRQAGSPRCCAASSATRGEGSERNWRTQWTWWLHGRAGGRAGARASERANDRVGAGAAVRAMCTGEGRRGAEPRGSPSDAHPAAEGEGTPRRPTSNGLNRPRRSAGRSRLTPRRAHGRRRPGHRADRALAGFPPLLSPRGGRPRDRTWRPRVPPGLWPLRRKRGLEAPRAARSPRHRKHRHSRHLDPLLTRNGN